ncbi:hypothetical protein GPECTOR_21g741 [Gonium pectorale]|uniref:UGP3-like C-terminal hexapeptide repeats domain-containing protein n=1 Tax=Gonium pectorale TaxID=33097 RepID=A0A150GIJ8_GONPE|nr:hypothetical protein GPECTOR_21g741 [Gonium pectorale]|eukprot:KXZ49515.1 hypothetical protein GPECTOR_21g741 [Gonium pectorale]
MAAAPDNNGWAQVQTSQRTARVSPPQSEAAANSPAPAAAIAAPALAVVPPAFAYPAPASGTVTSYEDEYASVPGGELPLEEQAARLEAMLGWLGSLGAGGVEERLEALRGVDSVAAFLQNPQNASVVAAMSRMDSSAQWVLLCLPAMLQEHVLMEPLGAAPSAPDALLPRLTSLASRLGRVETFYDSVGGLLGYQLKSLQLIVAGMKEKSARKNAEPQPPPAVAQSTSVPAAAAAASQPSPSVRFHVPRGVDLAGEAGSGVGVAAAAQGLASLPFTAEIYPVGGAGDRLGLVDEVTGESLPAAMLPYAGRTLMEALIRDLQAREYLYFQLTGRQVTTPVAIMTSDAKGNHGRVSGLLADLNWAGRGADSFRLFRQPMVPVVGVEDGRWLLSRPLGPMMKPGGHGAIWKLMWDEGVFEWLAANGRRAALVRQISNPIAGTDTTLLALAGAGFARRGGGGSAFGFMSCERAVGAAEGMNVLAERRRWVPDGAGGGRWSYEYGVTNVEYTEFEKLGLNDEAVAAGSKTSVFPANTNVLFVGLPGARRVVADAIARGDGEQLLPGLIFNLNKKVAYTDPLEGGTRQVTAGRMESTMQNLADYLADRFERPLEPQQLSSSQLSTFMVSNLRRKVTSSAKKRREPGSARIAQTPDGSFYDLQRNAWQILQRCGLKNVPEPGSPEQYLEKGPGFIFLFHPALGPLWDVISQKIVGGSLTHGSEMVLEVAEARLCDVHVDGSFQVYADNVMGHLEAKGGAAAASPSPFPSSPSAGTLAISSLLNGTTEMALPPHQQQLAQQLAMGAGGAGSGASAPPGGAAGLLRYSRRCGRIQMVNVRVRNAGIDWAAPSNVYWKHQVSRKESCKVVLLGQSEFEAHDVTIPGNVTFVVPDGFRMSLSAAADGTLLRRLTPLAAAPPEAGGGLTPSWEWQYVLDTSGAVRLSYVSSGPRVPAGTMATVMAAAESRNSGQYVLDFTI